MFQHVDGLRLGGGRLHQTHLVDRAAELDEHYKIRENAAAGVAAAKVKAGEAAQATKESLQERTANYRAGKGFTVEVPEGMRGGQTCEVDTPSGVMAVQIPVGLQPGARFAVEAPALTTMPSRLTGEPSGSRRIKNGLKAWRMKSSLRRPRRPSSPASSSEA